MTADSAVPSPLAMISLPGNGTTRAMMIKICALHRHTLIEETRVWLVSGAERPAQPKLHAHAQRKFELSNKMSLCTYTCSYSEKNTVG